MARCKPQKAANLLLLYSQNPEIRQVKTFDGWKKEHKTLRAGAHGYTFIADQKLKKVTIGMGASIHMRNA